MEIPGTGGRDIISKDLLKILMWKINKFCSSAQDDSPVSLAIAKASNKDQGMYYCCLSNVYGKVTAEFNLTSEGKSQFIILINDNGSFHSYFFNKKSVSLFPCSIGTSLKFSEL